MIVALPGLFSYFLCDCGTPWTFLLLFFEYSIDGILWQCICYLSSIQYVVGFLFLLGSGKGCGLAVCLWLGPPWFSYWFSFTLAYSGVGHGCSSLFIIVIDLIFMFSL